MRPGGHRLRPEVVSHHQRQRILRAAAEAIAASGYREVSVAEIVKRAGVGRGRFYEHFASKEECFLALYDFGASSALRAVEQASCGGDRSFAERIEAGVTAFLAYAEENPALARSCILEAPAAGAAANERFESALGDFASLFRAARGEVGEGQLPDGAEETLVGGLYWILYYALLEGRPKKLGRLLPQLSEFSLIPYAGAGAGHRL